MHAHVHKFATKLQNLSYLSDPPRVSQTELELGNNFEYDFMVSEGAYGSYELYGTVRLSFGAL